MKKLLLIGILAITLTACSETKEYIWTNNDGNDKKVECTYYKVGTDIESGEYTIKHTNTAYDEQKERIYSIIVSDKKVDCESEDFLYEEMYGGVGNKNEGTINVKDGQYVNIMKFENGEHGSIKLIKK